MTGTYWEMGRQYVDLEGVQGKEFGAKLDPCQKLSFAILMGAMKQSQFDMESNTRKVDIRHEVPTDTPIFADILFLLSPEATMYFETIREAWNGFPSQIDFIRMFLFRTQGWANFMVFLAKGDRLTKAYMRIVDEYLDELGITWRKND